MEQNYDNVYSVFVFCSGKFKPSVHIQEDKQYVAFLGG